MFDINDDEAKKANAFFYAIVALINASELDSRFTIAILAKVLTMISLSTDTTKTDFMKNMSFVYDFETYNKPDPTELN